MKFNFTDLLISDSAKIDNYCHRIYFSWNIFEKNHFICYVTDQLTCAQSLIDPFRPTEDIFSKSLPLSELQRQLKMMEDCLDCFHWAIASLSFGGLVVQMRGSHQVDYNWLMNDSLIEAYNCKLCSWCSLRIPSLF